MTDPSPPANPNSDVDPAAYIHMVQHLIEQCLLSLMSREECIAALDKHAHVEPLITAVVWDELEKSNKQFFRDYSKRTSDDAKLQDGVNRYLSARSTCENDENVENRC